MSRRPLGLALEMPPDETPSYRIDNSEIFVTQKLQIDKHGMRLNHPQVTRANEDELSLQPQNIKFENLKFVRQLGSGQSASVFEALDTTTQQHYAVKQISIANKEKRHQIIKELMTLHSTNSEHIIRFYGAFFSGGVINILLELMTAGPLDRVLSITKIEEAELSYLAKQICSGLLYLHERHQVHRDIKPSNVCLKIERCRCKLNDFGITSQLDDSQKACETFVGTCNYMSPERIMGAKYSYAADIWSLGLLLLECATGKFPYPTTGVYLEMMSSIVNGAAPTCPPELNFSEEFSHFISRCLEKAPEQRATAKELTQHPWLKLPISNSKTSDQMEKWIREIVDKIQIQTGGIDMKSNASTDIEQAFG